MKLARILLALLVLTAAGVAWAAQTAPTTAPEAPAVSNAPAENVQAPAQDDVLSLEIDGLFIEPTETGPCCRVDCMDAKTACLAVCGTDFVCRSNCADEYWACLTNC